MRRIALLALAIGFLVPFLAAAPAHAQATRTWVSGVGDDANPCSRTAPCKTFAGAISKTSASGEINCLDPGGFGGITITKAITLNCSATLGSILVAGTNGITINAGVGDNVIIRALQLQGLGPGGASPGLVGINILSAASVSIENCVITQFSKQGIADVRTAGNTKLSVKNTILSYNGIAGIGLGTTNPAGTFDNVVLDEVHSFNNGYGVVAGNLGNQVMIRRSVFAGNTTAGVDAETSSAITVDQSVISGNTTGVNVGTGTVRLSDNDIAFNGTGITGATTSFGTNRISGNATAGTAPTTSGSSTPAFSQQ
jgi:hypothetical protein